MARQGQDVGESSTGGTPVQPVRTLSTIGFAAASTCPTDAARAPSFADSAAWSPMLATVACSEDRACWSAST
jgi:hypothetical protein